MTSVAGTRAGSAGTRWTKFRKELKSSWAWYPFILVNLAVFLVFNFIPWLSMFSISLRDTDLLSYDNYVGLGNFTNLAQDPQVHRAVINTFQYVVMYVPVVLVISLFVAILVNRPLFGMKFFRALYFLPNVTSIAVLALIFRRLLSPRPDAPINYLLGLAGIPPQTFLINPDQAMPSLVAISLWEVFGYYMVIWLAGLQGIPQELYDAGLVDGAAGWKLHRYVTLPLLRPTAAFIVVISTIGALQIFGSVFILTGGGPVYATTTIVYQIYLLAFNFTRFGYASALSVLLFFIVLIITLIQARWLRWGEDVY